MASCLVFTGSYPSIKFPPLLVSTTQRFIHCKAPLVLQCTDLIPTAANVLQLNFATVKQTPDAIKYEMTSSLSLTTGF